MKIFEKKWIYLFLVFLTILVLFFSFLDINFNLGWIQTIAASYAILFLMAIILLYLKSKQVRMKYIEEFEKSLKGGLYHYKCPKCEGIFAVKKSRENHDKDFLISCPQCNIKGVIKADSFYYIRDKIPEKKSAGIKFICNKCGEKITVWSEGDRFPSNMYIFSCPYCGDRKNIEKI